jgi:hypothetical protein
VPERINSSLDTEGVVVVQNALGSYLLTPKRDQRIHLLDQRPDTKECGALDVQRGCSPHLLPDRQIQRCTGLAKQGQRAG